MSNNVIFPVDSGNAENIVGTVITRSYGMNADYGFVMYSGQSEEIPTDAYDVILNTRYSGWNE